MADALAEDLNLPVCALNAVEFGWSKEHIAYTSPERNATGLIIGFGLRDRDGNKKQILGSHRGLIIPKGFADSLGPILLPEGTT